MIRADVGFVLTKLGHISEAAEHFEWDEFRFEVMDMDRQRIDRLLVSLIPKTETTTTEETQ
jgi:putative hemolysin